MTAGCDRNALLTKNPSDFLSVGEHALRYHEAVPISSDIVGRTGDPITHQIDGDWLASYASVVGGSATTSHPLFPVCFEWPLFLDSRHMPTDLPPGDLFRGVHATHDLTLYRPIRAGMQVTTTATIVSVQTRRSGARELVRLDTVDAGGEPVSTTWFGMIYRGLDVVGGDRSLQDGEPVLEPVPVDEGYTDIPIPVAADAAVTYAEGARIWNPVHTDAAVARAAGLPGTILQGTATLAMAVSMVAAERFDGDTDRVERVAARFGAMVFMPSTLTLRLSPVVDGAVRFEVLTPDGGRAIRDGLLAVRDR